MAKGDVKVFELNIDLQPQIDKVLDEIGRSVVQDLKKTSPKLKNGKGGEYARGWDYVKVGKNKIIVYNGGRDRTLTHLLENGHAIVRKGRKLGHAKAIPHIKPAYERGKKLGIVKMKKIKIEPKK